MEYEDVCLDAVVDLVRHHLQDGNNSNVEGITARLLEQNEFYSMCLSLNVPLTNELDTRTFKALLSCFRIRELFFCPELQARDAESMLQQAIPIMPSLECVNLAFEMTESDAESIFSMLGTIPLLRKVHIYMGDTTECIANPLVKLLRSSNSLTELNLSWASWTEAKPPLVMQQDSFQSICNGICQSTAIRGIRLWRMPPPTDHDAETTSATMLAHAFSDSSTITMLQTYKAHSFFQHVRNTPAIQDFDLCFSPCASNGDFGTMLLFRNIHWKTILAEDVPLGLWSHVLAATKFWTRLGSHRPQDALLFLLKEKNDVLLQNVRRRKTRKRKRFQIS